MNDEGSSEVRRVARCGLQRRIATACSLAVVLLAPTIAAAEVDEPDAIATRHRVMPWLSFDGDVAVADSTIVASAGLVYHLDATSVSLRARGIDQRRAVDDPAATTERDLVADLVATHQLRERFELRLTIVNLLDRARPDDPLAADPREVLALDEIEDLHATPGMPLTAMLELGLSY